LGLARIDGRAFTPDENRTIVLFDAVRVPALADF
jgi:hypothetical protein